VGPAKGATFQMVGTPSRHGSMRPHAEPVSPWAGL